MTPSVEESSPEADQLRVQFAGSLVGQQQYTTQTGELMRGSLRGITGAEVQSAEGVLLEQGQGLTFHPRTQSSQGCVVEVRFTPSEAAVQDSMLVGCDAFAIGIRHGHLTLVSANSERDLSASESGPILMDGRQNLSIRFTVGPDGGLALSGEINGSALDGVQLETSVSDITHWFGTSPQQAAAFSGVLHQIRIGAADAPFLYQNRARQSPIPTSETDTHSQGFGEIACGNYQDVSPSDSPATIVAKASRLRPTPLQATWQEEGLTAFIHFGMNTFYAQEWGHGDEDPERFNPTALNVDSWVRQLRDAGFRTTIITLKHHDGFHLWPTRYSTHSVASSPWSEGRGNIARLATEAARRYGMKVGFYLSPADSNAELRGIYGNGSKPSVRTVPDLVPGDDRRGLDLARFEFPATDYGALFLNTLYEILTEYGPVHEVWFDGADGNTHSTENYDYAAFHELIHALQAGATIAVGGRDIQWVGNELGIARHNEWASVPIIDEGEGKIEVVQDGIFSEDLGSDGQLVHAVQIGLANRLHWFPTESDMRITAGWFAHDDDVPKSPTLLLDHYEKTYGRNSVMLLNVPPTRTGQFSTAASEAVAGFAGERRKAFTVDHALGRDALIAGSSVMTVTDGDSRQGHEFTGAGPWHIEFDLDNPSPISRVGLSEAIRTSGQSAREFSIEAMIDDHWQAVGGGGTVGAHRVVNLQRPIVARRWRITISSARSAFAIAAVNLWEELSDDPGLVAEVFVDPTAPRAGTGSRESPLKSMAQLSTVELAPGATVFFRAGTDCPDSPATLWGYGVPGSPLTVRSYGDGGAPTVSGRSLSDRFSAYRSQGWLVSTEGRLQ